MEIKHTTVLAQKQVFFIERRAIFGVSGSTVFGMYTLIWSRRL